MKRQTFLALFTLLLYINVKAQKNENIMISVFYKGESDKINTKNSSDIYDVIYSMFTNYNTIPTDKVSVKKFDKEDIFFKNNLPSEKMISAIDSLSKNSKLSLLTQFNKQQLLFQSHFPGFFKKNNDINFVEIKLKSFDAIGKNKISIDSIHSVNNNWGTLLSKGITYHTIEIQDNLNISDKKVAGSAIYNVKIVTDYKIQKLDRLNLINSFSINNKDIKIIEIYNKIFVFDVLNESNNFKQKSEHFNFFAIDINDKNETKLGSKISYPIYKDLYNIYKSNRKITKEELKKILPVERLQKMKENGFYYAIEQDTQYENNVLFYSKIYGISKDIKVKI